MVTGGASRPSSAPAAGSARHRADATVVTAPRAAQPTTCIVPEVVSAWLSCSAAPSTRHRWCPRPDQQPLSGCVGRDVLAGLAYHPGAAGAVPVRVRSAHLPGFAGREEGFGIREDSIGRCARGSAREIDARDAGSRHVECTSLESCRHSHRRSASIPTAPIPERRANVQKGARPRGSTVFGTVSRLGWPPERRGYALAWLLSPRKEHWRDASAGKKAHVGATCKTLGVATAQSSDSQG